MKQRRTLHRYILTNHFEMNICRPVHSCIYQEFQIMFTSNIRMVFKYDLSDAGKDVGAKTDWFEYFKNCWDSVIVIPVKTQ